MTSQRLGLRWSKGGKEKESRTSACRMSYCFMSAMMWSILLHPTPMYDWHLWINEPKSILSSFKSFLSDILTQWWTVWLHLEHRFLELIPLPNWNFVSFWLVSFNFHYLQLHFPASFCELNSFRLYNILCWLLTCLDWEMPRTWGKHASGWASEGVPKMIELPITQEKKKKISTLNVSSTVQ